MIKCQFLKLKLRKCDKYGDGYFGAPRGKRIHKGIDLISYPDDNIAAYTDGIITKIGYCYNDDLSYRYIEIFNEEYYHRFFYIKPQVEKGDIIKKGDTIGKTQDIVKRYPGITPHIHYEILDKEHKNYIDPTSFYNKYTIDI